MLLDWYNFGGQNRTARPRGGSPLTTRRVCKNPIKRQEQFPVWITQLALPATSISRFNPYRTAVVVHRVKVETASDPDSLFNLGMGRLDFHGHHQGRVR